MRRLLPLLLCLALLLPAAAGAEKYETLPPCQQITQTEQRTALGNGLSVTVSRPHTVNDAVNAALDGALSALEERGRVSLPLKPVNM